MKKESIKKNIYFSSMILTLFLIFTKSLGLLKHIVVAKYIGANIETDAFYIATGVIGHLSVLLFSALSVSLLTIYTEKKEKDGHDHAKSLIASAFRFFIPVAVLITIVFYFFSPVIAKILAPSYSDEQLISLIKYVKIMSFSFVPCCYYIIGNVILEEEKIFIPGRFKDLLQHVFIIIAVVFLYNEYGTVSLVYSFFAASVVQALIIFLRIRKYYISKSKEYNNNNEIKQLVLISLPLLLGNAVYEINDIVDKQIATGLGSGFASLLTYGATINEMIVGIIINSISIVLFSNFVSYVVKKDYSNIENKLVEVLCILTAVLVPIMIIFIFGGIDIVKILYGHGKLSSNDFENIYYVLIGYSFGFIFQAFRTNFVKVLYAFQKNKNAMINGVFTVLINIILSVILSKIFGIGGVALATSISIVFGIILMFRDVKKVLPGITFTALFKDYWKIVLSGVITSSGVLLLKNVVIFNPLMNLIIISLFTFSLYTFLLYIFKFSFSIKFKN